MQSSGGTSSVYTSSSADVLQCSGGVNNHTASDVLRSSDAGRSRQFAGGGAIDSGCRSNLSPTENVRLGWRKCVDLGPFCRQKFQFQGRSFELTDISKPILAQPLVTIPCGTVRASGIPSVSDPVSHVGQSRVMLSQRVVCHQSAILCPMSDSPV